MPLNGSGTYAAPASTWNPAVASTTINSTDWALLLADITTALSTAIYKDGQSTPTANVPMGGFRITGLGLATAVTDAARASQVQNSSFTSLTSVAGTNTVTATATPTPAAYVVGQLFKGIAAVTNTGATTLNISGLGAGAVQVGGAALTGGELIANAPFAVIVSAVTPVFQLIANGQVAPFLDTNALVKGSADGTKKVRFEVDGLTTATTRVLTVQDSDDVIVGRATTDTLTNKTLTSPVINTGVTGTAVATQAQQETGSATDVLVTPGRQQFHASAAKYWAYINGSTNALDASYNVTSITDNGAGDFTVNLTTAFSSANHADFVTSRDDGPLLLANVLVTTTAAGAVRAQIRTAGGVGTDPNHWSIAGFGDQ